MSVPIALRRQTEEKCDKDEADSSFLFRCKDKNVAPNALGGHGGSGVKSLNQSDPASTGSTVQPLNHLTLPFHRPISPSQRRRYICSRRWSKLERRRGNGRPRFIGIGRNEPISIRL